MAVVNITVVDPRAAAIDSQVLEPGSERGRDAIARLIAYFSGIAGGVMSCAGMQVAIGSGTAVTKASGTVALAQASLTAGDIVQVGSVGFVATNGAVTLGQATFDMRTSNNAVGVSLAAQINAHAALAGLVSAVNASGTVTITATLNSALSNNIGLSKKVTTAAGVILNGLANTVNTSSLGGGASGVDATPTTYLF